MRRVPVSEGHTGVRFLTDMMLEAVTVILRLSRAKDPVVSLIEWTPTRFVSEALYDRGQPLGKPLD